MRGQIKVAQPPCPAQTGWSVRRILGWSSPSLIFLARSESSAYPLPHNCMTKEAILTTLSLAALLSASAIAQSPAAKLEGMWSDPPKTAIGQLCFFWCTDRGIAYINKLLDDPANDARPYAE